MRSSSCLVAIATEACMNNKRRCDYYNVNMAKSKEKKAGQGKKSSEGKKPSGEKSKSKGTNESKEGKEAKEQLTWQERLSQVQLNEDGFKCSVVMFVQTEPQFEEYLQHFEEMCDTGRRRCINVVSMKQIKEIFEYKERRTKREKDESEKELTKKESSKTKKDRTESKKDDRAEKIPKELFEIAEDMFLQRNVTTEIMAYLVKCQLIEVKNYTIEKAEMEKRLAEEIELESKIICDDGKTGKKEGKKAKETKVGKKKKEETGEAAATPTIETADKKLTKLRKRGEEWRDVRYIEDFPLDGPNLYVALVGFHDPTLLAELRKLDVPLNGLVKVADSETPEPDPFPSTITTTGTPPSFEEIGSSEMDFILEPFITSMDSLPNAYKKNEFPDELSETVFKTTRLTSSSFGLTKKYSDMEQIFYFWSQIERDQTQMMLKDVASLTLVPKNFPPKEDAEDPEIWKEKVYDEISYTMYDIQDLCRQHDNYIRNMYMNDTGPFPPMKNSDMELYDTMVRLIPSECMSVHYILHCMLEQVIVYDAPKNPPPSPKLSRSSNEVITSHEHKTTEPGVFLKELLEQLEIHYGLTKCEVFDYEIADPRIILYGDTLLKLTREIDIPEVNIPQITIDILRWFPIIKLWEWYPPLNESERLMYNYHLNKLLHCMEQDFVTDRLLRFYLMITVLEQLPCRTKILRASEEEEASPNGTGEVQYSDLKPSRRRSSSCESFRIPHPQPEELEDQTPMEEQTTHDIRNMRDLLECPELMELLLHNREHQHGETGAKYPHCCDYNMFRYVHVENLKPQVILQVLQESLDIYNCLEWKYFKPVDSLLLRFHNAQKQCKWEVKWCGSLRTPVGLRDFNKYVLQEEEQWFLDQEQIHQKDIEERTKGKILEAEIKISKELQNSCTAEEFVMAGSIKQEIKNLAEKKLHDLESEFIKKYPIAQIGSESYEKSSQASSFPSMSLPESSTKSSYKDFPVRTSNLISALHCAQTGSCIFEGYDLGPHKVKVTGSTTKFYSPDGTNVKIERSKWLYQNTLIHSQFEKLGHSLSIYSYAGPPATVNDPMTFHLTAKNGIVLAFSRRNPFLLPKLEEDVEKDLTTVESETFRPVLEKTSNTKQVKKGKGKEKKTTSEVKKKSAKGSKKKEDRELSQEIPVKEESSTEDAITEITHDPEVPFHYDMRLSCPNSLTIETVVGTEESEPFYIRQKYLTKGPTCDQIRDESYRCYLRNGNVLIFRTDGTVKILTPDSTIFFCKEFDKPPPPSPPPQRTPSENQPDKSVTEAEVKSKKSKAKTTAQSKKKKGQKGKKEKVDEVPEDTQEEIDKVVSPDFPSPDLQSPFHSLSQKSYLWEVTDYEMLTAHGVKYRVQNGVKKEIDYPMLLRIATDFEIGEVFTRREEGTNTLLNQDGELNVLYPDGTRISTSPEEVEYFEWSVDELKEIQDIAMCEYSKEINISKESTKGEMPTSLPELRQITLSQLVDTLQTSTSNRSQSYEFYRESIIRGSKLEPFVLVGLSCKIEHPNYATVSYEARNLSSSITCPRGLKVTVDRTGSYKAQLDKNSLLEVNSLSIIFEASVCNDCRSSSRTYVALKGFLPLEKSEDIMSSTTDDYGNTFNVNYLGIPTHYAPSVEEEAVTHVCFNTTPEVRERYLVLYRDLSGTEFIHGDDLQNYLQLVGASDCGSMNVDKMPGKAEQLNCYTTFLPVRKKESAKWITQVDVESHLPTNLKRKDLQRSTYSEPPSWLIPFPKQRKTNKSKLKTISNIKMSISSLDTSPKFLVLRIIQDIEIPDHNVIDDVQTGLLKYWNDVKLIYKEYDNYKLTDTRTQEERKIDEKLFALYAAQVSKEVLEKYRLGLNPMSPSSEEATSVSSDHKKYMEDFCLNLKEEKEHSEFYKDLLRTKNVPGYFNTIEGEAFSTVLQLVEGAVNISAYDCTEAHEHTEACRNAAMKEKFIPAFLEEMIPSGSEKFQSKRVQVDIHPNTMTNSSQTDDVIS